MIGGLFKANNKNSISNHGRDMKVKLERDIDNEVILLVSQGWKLQAYIIRTQSYSWPTVSGASL